MKQIVKILPLIIPLFASGCFSAASRSDFLGGKRTPTTGQAVEAATLDVVTLPIQAIVLPPAYASVKFDEAKRERTAKEYRQLMTLLESNATVAIQERWDLKKDQYRQVFIDSFSNPKVKYTQSELDEIRSTCPDVRDYVFRSQSCSPQYLAQHFDEELERGNNPALQIGLASIVSNPNTPFELVYKTTQIRGPACASAYEAVDKRKAEARNFYMKLLENNPRLGLEENWDKKYPKYIFFIESFSNPNVKYNDDLLEQIYQNCPEVQDYVFRCQYCSASFLMRHFDEAYTRSTKWSYQHSLEDILANPNTPIDLIEKVAASKDFERTIGNHGNLSYQAQQILSKQHSKQ